MKRLRKYILNNFSALFLSIFVPLFAIASVIFLIKLAAYTAIIQLTIWEMTKLYIFILPQLLFYTLPITFFVAATLSLFKLSNDNEVIVLFALGIKPAFIVRTFFWPAILLSAVMFFNFIIITPHATVLSKNFISYKKSEAKFNLSASEFGNSFGDWLLYLGKKNKDGSFEKVFLFNKKQKEEILIAAKKAQVINDAGILRLKLTNGQGYSYSTEKFSQINFKTMFINDTMKTDLINYKKPLQYWFEEKLEGRKKHLMIRNTLMSLFPVLTLFLVVSFGIVQVRHQKSKIYLYMFLTILFFYAGLLAVEKHLGFYTIPAVALFWLGVSYMYYRKTIVKKF
ncbi:LptF/LptG family permease [Sulfurimonas paralvinellae]|uniref:LptF/LptG family permease n=1 Tax=Sulfurimonas paralvinellae TaxID=317658 RepID=A0A7M1B7A2_9BACT|nr:LptF/LptG family permease [Sulfurimonas paralvinellae]QOP45571.1 LptF/LptG family permease [Sulfurimonas paralvinellae]